MEQSFEEIGSSGEKAAGYVYAGGELLARQANNEVVWEHVTPANSGKYELRAGGTINRVEFDPLGADVGLFAPPTPDTGGGGGDIGGNHTAGLMDSRYADLANPGGGCVVNGFSASCSEAMIYINFGTGNSTSILANASVTMHDIAHSIGVMFASAGASKTVLNVSGMAGTSGHSSIEWTWVKAEGYGWYYGPVPTAYSGTTAMTGGIVSLAHSVQSRQSQNTLTNDHTASMQNGLNRASELVDRSRCGNFINALLQRAATVIDALWWGTPEKYTQTNGIYNGIGVAGALWSYHDALDKGWVTASGNPGTAGQNVTYGTTTPSGHYPVSWNNEFFDLSQDDAGLHTLHESLHQYPGFDDQTLANAARWVDTHGNGYRDYTSLKDPVGQASRDLNDYIRRYCAP
jgi:hypothetical protein